MATRSTSTRELRSDDNTPDRNEHKRVQTKKKRPAVSKIGAKKPAASTRATKGARKPKKGGTKGPSAMPRFPPAR
jgi:hypothetical protein